MEESAGITPLPSDRPIAIITIFGEASSRDFCIEELDVALKTLKVNKAAGFDGVYPEFLKAIGPKTKLWLIEFFNEILRTGNLPRLFKQAKIIAILKPGKDGTDASHYRPVSLLSMTFKVIRKAYSKSHTRSH